MEQDKPHTGLRAANGWPEGYAATSEYRLAISGKSSDSILNYNWADKPHRLVFDLCHIIECLLSAPAPDKAGDREGVARAARVLLDACYEDCGRPEPVTDPYRDDGPVGSSAKRDMALTFKMMRDLEDALVALTTGNETLSAAYDVETKDERLRRLKVEWSNHQPISEGDHPWLLRMATLGVEAVPTPDSPAPAPSGTEREASQGTLADEPYDPLKCAIWAALVPFQYELRTTGGVTFMGLRNSIVEAVRSFAISSQKELSAREALEDLKVAADDLAQLSASEGDDKAAGALQFVSGFISDRLACIAPQDSALRPAPTGSGEPDSRAGVEREALDRLAQAMESEAEVKQLDCGTRFWVLRRSPADFIAALQSAPIASAAAGPVGKPSDDVLFAAEEHLRLSEKVASNLGEKFINQAALWCVRQFLATPTPDPHPVPAMEGR